MGKQINTEKVNFNEHVEYQKSEMDKLICKYKSVKYDVGTVSGYEARIDLVVDKYCSKRPYRCT